ncbi:MAG: PAS domain S-box protein [Desulfobacteraceae bacterium]|jgi:PAS domain S-box-containing protein
MRPFNFSIRLFKSKLGRKFFTVFVCCALLPILFLSSITYTLVTNQLEDQTHNQLQRAAKSFGLTIYDRLLLVDAQLQLLVRSTRDYIHRLDKFSETLDKSVWSNLDAVALVKPQGVQFSFLGRISFIPTFSTDVWSHLSSGYPTLITQPHTKFTGRKVYVVRAIFPNDPKAGILLAEIKPKYLWSLGDANPLPPMTEFCVTDSNNEFLINTISTANYSQIKHLTRNKSGGMRQDQSEEDYRDDILVSQWTLFFKPKFLISGWKITLVQLNENIFKPVHEFKRVFLLSILLTFWIILLISIVYIRKSLIPLEKLREGTRRILQGKFDIPVEHRSGDEFDALIDSFNQMSCDLGRQVRGLRGIALIGRKTAGITDSHQLLDIELEIMEKELGFAGALVLLVGSSQQSLRCVSWYGWNESEDEQLKQVNIPIKALSQQDIPTRTMQAKEAAIWHRPDKGTTNLSELNIILLKLTDAQMLYCAPIIYENFALGLLIVESQKGQSISESDQELIKGIAAQTASGIYNSISFKKLRSSEERFRSLFDNAAAGMGLIDANGMIVKANTHLGEIVGYQAKQLHGSNWRSFSHPDDIDKTIEVSNILKAGKRPTELYEMRLIHQNGREVPVLISTSMVRDESSDSLFYISHVQDLSEQKAAEAEKKEIESKLIQSQKLEAMGTLAGGIAHDFNNIISALMGQAELGLLELDHTLKIKDRFDGILKAAHRAKALVQQILTFSRQSEQKKQVVQLSSLVKETMDLLGATLPANIIIDSNMLSDKDYILADPNKIHQVIMNLGTNAYQAMAETGGMLTVKLENICIDSSESGSNMDINSGNFVKVSVSDTGCGIDPETLKRIFDPYFTTKEKGKGTGLGLALVHGIIKEHGGSITVESQKGRGTTFIILLPQWEDEVVKENVSSEIQGGGTQRILFVDDEPVLIELASDLLTHLGYQIESCQNPMDALELLRSEPNRFDLVITDYNMPKMNGDKLACEIEKIKPDLPVILCSGYQEWRNPNDDLPKTLKAVLPKPFTLKELSGTINKALS